MLLIERKVMLSASHRDMFLTSQTLNLFFYKSTLLTSVVHTELRKEKTNKAEQISDTFILDSVACLPSHWGLRLTHSSQGFWSCARLTGGPEILKKRLHFLWEAPSLCACVRCAGRQRGKERKGLE